jgi:hypothetical protein
MGKNKSLRRNTVPTYLTANWKEHEICLNPYDCKRICGCFRRIPYYVGDRINVQLEAQGKDAKNVIKQVPIFEEMPRFGVEDKYIKDIDLTQAQVFGNNKKAYLKLETSVIERPGDIRYAIAGKEVIDSKIPLPTMIQNVLLLTAGTSEERWYKQINYIFLLLSAIIGSIVALIVKACC